MTERLTVFTLILNCTMLAACGSPASQGISLPRSDTSDAAAMPHAREDAGQPMPEPDAGSPDACVPPPRLTVGGSYSTVQLLAMLTDPGICPSGWTTLFEERFGQGKGEEALIPLQPAYVREVDDYGDLPGLADAIIGTHTVLGAQMPVVRISLFWPCVMANETVLAGYRDLITAVYGAGYEVELALVHHASYPAALHFAPAAVGTIGGWAHPDAPEAFSAYVTTVLAEIGPILSLGTSIDLAMEPVPQLMDGYIHREGKIPPGGRNAGHSLAVAMTHMRDAFLEAGPAIRAAGFVPAIGMNIRPLVGDAELPGAELLDFLHNDWFTDAMVGGCIDDDFDGVCESSRPPAVDRIGVTFYGVMHASRDTTEFGLPGWRPELVLARREFYPSDFAPDPTQLRAALTRIETRYTERITDGSLTFGVAELGFSSGNPTTQLSWLDDALAVIGDFPVRFLTIHAPLRHAEFSSGDWYFHLVSRCCPPELTDWGRLALDALSVWNVNRAACE
ncbi:hypothetical protein HY635_03235 [Candidatus Uhrbacteria bacterium]|nr:hypothetical protein [Candidatus Uhrbacteria bacterium]